MAHIGARLLAAQRIQVVAAGDALRELAQLGAREQLAQFRLADEDDLQQLLRRRLQVRQQPHVLEHLRRQVLRFVDDQDDAPALGVRREQAPIQPIDELLDAAPVGSVDRNPELLADAQQKFRGRDPRIQDDRDVGVLRHARQQRAHDGRLAGADLAGQLHETAGLVDAVQQVRERLGVPLAQVEIARVRRDRERPLV